MNVLLVSPWQTGAGASGVASACRHLAEGLTAHSDVDEVVVLSLSDLGGTARASDGLRVELIRRQTSFALLTNGWPEYVRAARWLRAAHWRPDVVHGQGFAGEGHLAVRLARGLRVPAVVTVHGMVDKEARLYGDPRRAALARRVMRQTLRGAQGIVFVSPYRKDELTLSSGSEVRVIENAIADDVFDVSNDGAGSAILYAGFVGPRKRLRDLVRALPIVRRAVPAAHLRVAGPVSDRDYARAAQSEITALGLEDAVTFLGPLDGSALRAEYAAAGVLALPSEEENAPQVIAEAMAAGVPVVATDVGGVRWMIPEGKAGFVVRVGDVDGLGGRIAAVLSDPHRVEMSLNARAEAGRFRRERVARHTLDLYRTLIGRAAR